MEEIPTALQTDRMLAPRPEFTKVVMQQVIVRQQISPRIEGTWVQSVSSQISDVPATGSEEANKLSFNKMVSLEGRSSYRPKTASTYVLRFSSLAAVVVVMITLGVYVLAGPSSDLPNTTAAVYGGIQGFADTVRNALSNPLDVLIGGVLAVVVMVSLWYYVTRPNRTRH